MTTEFKLRSKEFNFVYDDIKANYALVMVVTLATNYSRRIVIELQGIGDEKAVVKYSIINDKNEVVITSTPHRPQINYGAGITNYWTLKNEAQKYLPGGTLRLACEFTITHVNMKTVEVSPRGDC